MTQHKNTKLHLPISSEDKDLLRRRAEQSGLNLTAYCLLILLKSRIEVKVEGEG